MARKGGRGGGDDEDDGRKMSKKDRAQAKENAAEAAAQKAAEDRDWADGTEGKSKAKAAKEDKADALRKKREAIARAEAEDEASISSSGGGGGGKKNKAAQKKTGRAVKIPDSFDGLDDDDDDDNNAKTYNASNIDDAIAAMDIVDGKTEQLDRHPERRVAAAYEIYKERRLEEMKTDGTGAGLRRDQRLAIIHKEFKKSPENPMNQANNIAYDAKKSDIADKQKQNKDELEDRLVGEDKYVADDDDGDN